MKNRLRRVLIAQSNANTGGLSGDLIELRQIAGRVQLLAWLSVGGSLETTRKKDAAPILAAALGLEEVYVESDLSYLCHTHMARHHQVGAGFRLELDRDAIGYLNRHNHLTQKHKRRFVSQRDHILAEIEAGLLALETERYVMEEPDERPEEDAAAETVAVLLGEHVPKRGARPKRQSQPPAEPPDDEPKLKEGYSRFAGKVPIQIPIPGPEPTTPLDKLSVAAQKVWREMLVMGAGYTPRQYATAASRSPVFTVPAEEAMTAFSELEEAGYAVRYQPWDETKPIRLFKPWNSWTKPPEADRSVQLYAA